MKYQVALSKAADKDLSYFIRLGDKTILRKIKTLLHELENHPETGTGQVEALRGNLQGYWSRRINRQHRMLYRIENSIVTVIVLSMRGHYDDK